MDAIKKSPKSRLKKKSIDMAKLRLKYSLKDCGVILTDIMLNKSLKFVNNRVKLPEERRKKYTCYICWSKFFTYKEMNDHKSIKHIDDVNEIVEKHQQTVTKTSNVQTKKQTKSNGNNKVNLTSTPNHKCLTCQTSFETTDAIKIHHANKCKFLCGVCEKTYNTNYAFTVHILQHRINVLKTQSSKALHKCSLCSQSFMEYFQLKTHTILMHKTKTSKSTEKNANNPNEFSCELCFDVFSSQKDLQDHMEFHKQLNTSSDRPDDDNDDDEETNVSQPEGVKETDSGLVIPAVLENPTLKEPMKDIKKDNDMEDVPVIAPNLNQESSGDSTATIIMESTSSKVDDALPDTVPEYESLNANNIIPTTHYRCKKCDRIYMNLNEFNDHVKYQKCTIVSQCKLCKQSFDKNSDLFEHISTNHHHLQTCQFCFETFYAIKKLDEHKLLYHFKTFKNLCKICFQCFPSFEDFNSHLQDVHLNI